MISTLSSSTSNFLKHERNGKLYKHELLPLYIVKILINYCTVVVHFVEQFVVVHHPKLQRCLKVKNALQLVIRKFYTERAVDKRIIAKIICTLLSYLSSIKYIMPLRKYEIVYSSIIWCYQHKLKRQTSIFYSDS